VFQNKEGKTQRWFGHVESMENNRLPRRVLHCYIEDKRSRRQAKTWMDNIKKDLKTQEYELQNGNRFDKRQNKMENSCANPSSA